MDEKRAVITPHPQDSERRAEQHADTHGPRADTPRRRMHFVSVLDDAP